MSGAAMRPLPGVLAQIGAVTSAGAALRLALALGGRSVHVPRPQNLGAGHPLAMAVGADAAKICERFQGECLYIPKARRHLVRHLHAGGLGIAGIAERLGVTRPTVRQYLRGD